MLSQFDWGVFVGDKVLLQLHVGDKVGRDGSAEGEDGGHHHLGENVDEGNGEMFNNVENSIHRDIEWVNINITTATVEPALATMEPIHRERMN